MAIDNEQAHERRRDVTLEERRIYRQLDTISDKLELLIRLEEKQNHLEHRQGSLEDRVEEHGLHLQTILRDQNTANIRLAQLENLRHEVERILTQLNKGTDQLDTVERKQIGIKSSVDTVFSIAKVVLGLLLAMGLWAGYVNNQAPAKTPVPTQQQKSK